MEKLQWHWAFLIAGEFGFMDLVSNTFYNYLISFFIIMSFTEGEPLLR